MRDRKHSAESGVQFIATGPTVRCYSTTPQHLQLQKLTSGAGEDSRCWGYFTRMDELLSWELEIGPNYLCQLVIVVCWLKSIDGWRDNWTNRDVIEGKQQVYSLLIYFRKTFFLLIEVNVRLLRVTLEINRKNYLLKMYHWGLFLFSLYCVPNYRSIQKILWNYMKVTGP